jgi:hypothetical protein
LTTSDGEPHVFYLSTVRGEVYRSEDGGSSWERLEVEWPAGLQPQKVRAIAAAAGSSRD